MRRREFEQSASLWTRQWRVEGRKRKKRTEARAGGSSSGWSEQSVGRERGEQVEHAGASGTERGGVQGLGSPGREGLQRWLVVEGTEGSWGLGVV